MPRVPLVAALLATLALTAAPAAANAQLTAASPADGAAFTQGDTITFNGAGAGGGFTEIKLIVTVSPPDANGRLTAAEQFPPVTYASGDAWTISWTARDAGTFYWQAQHHDCTGPGGCHVEATQARLLTVAVHPSLIRPAPAPVGPAADARVTLGKAVALSAKDLHANRMTYEVSRSPHQNADGRFAGPLWSKTAASYDRVGYEPPSAGTYYWHAVRESCLFTSEFVPGTALYLPVDCSSRRTSSVRAFVVAAPAPSLRLGASGRAYESGSIHFELRCDNPPCRVTVTGTFTGKGTGGLPTLRRTVTKDKAKLTFHSLRPTRSQQRRIAAAVARRGRVKLVLRARSRDAFGQQASQRDRIVLRRPKPPKPRKPKSPEQRAAERMVGLRVAEYYAIGEDRTAASCRRSDGRVGWKCTWSTRAIEEPWGETCWYNGEADATRVGGDWWETRLYDVEDSCY
jgi:hypothetical protein